MSPPLKSQVEQLLISRGCTNIRQYSTYNFGRSRDEHCLSVVLSEPQASEVLGQLRQTLPMGLIAFMGTGGTEIVIGEGKDQFDMIRLARTQAPAYSLSTENIVSRLQAYDAQAKIDIRLAETDTIEMNVLENPDDLDAFAMDIARFAPDTINQGGLTVEMLAMQIDITRFVRLWWD